MTPVKRAADALGFRCLRAQQHVLYFAERLLRDLGERLAIDVVVDAHHGIDAARIIGQRAIVEVLKRQTREDRPRRLALDVILCGKTAIAIARLV